MRATLFYTEGCVYTDIDRPKNTTQIFTMSSIKDYTQSRGSRSSIPNTYEVQFVDETKSYEPQLFTLEDPVFQKDPNIEQRSKTLQLRGVTNESQAKSLAKYVLYAGKHGRTSINFKTGTQGLRSMVGDVVGVQHDVPEWGVAGKVANWVSGTATLTLSTPFLFEYSQEVKAVWIPWRITRVTA